MRIHEVCQATGLTKKAINWYEEQGLIAIPTDENGYRDFQDADIQKLKEIGLLRSLGLSAKEIETVLRASDKPAVLKAIQAQKQSALEAQQFQVELLGKLSQNYTSDTIEQLRQEWNSAPIGQKLQSAFPGSLDGSYFNIFSPTCRNPSVPRNSKTPTKQSSPFWMGWNFRFLWPFVSPTAYGEKLTTGWPLIQTPGSTGF